MTNTSFAAGLLLGSLLIVSCNLTSKEEKNNSPGVSAFRLEAEDMDLSGYNTEYRDTVNFIKLSGPDGMAHLAFPFASGYYDIDARYLSEQVGQNTYSLYIANNQIVAWLGKDRDDKWHFLSEQKWHIPRSIHINNGDEIRIEALAENGSGVIIDYIEFIETTSRKPLKTSHPGKEEIMKSPPTLANSSYDMVSIFPEEYLKAIRNPLKGFRSRTEDHEYASLIKYYFKWNELENLKTDGVERIKKTCDARWAGIEQRNIKAIPRVYLDWPGRESGWPEDMKSGDYTSEKFRKRILAFIKKLAEAWDDDPRVAYVEMGLIGEWGEMEFPDTREEIKEAIADQFNESFQHKLVMIRWPNTYKDHIYNFGYYWDSFAHHDQEYCGFHINNTSPKWQRAVIGGEVAYNWGSVHLQPGEEPDSSLKKPEHRDYVIDRIRRLHANHLGWIADYSADDSIIAEGAATMQKALGYRFVITEITYPKTVENAIEFPVSFKVKNEGSSPFYYKWPLEISLLDTASRQVQWKKICEDIDIRSWLPGDQWNDSAKIYNLPARIYTENLVVKTETLAPGEYILAIAILDPAGNQPSARFAIKNYYKGGRHPIGRIGVEQTADTFTIAGFDDMQADTSIGYKLNKQ